MYIFVLLLYSIYGAMIEKVCWNSLRMKKNKKLSHSNIFSIFVY